ncbi:L-threonylcarbamoyladenylate synthase [Arenibaculum pallidiluteum]|uniref:L-threonylcarbamoyladenylate synthase n=1 Tax=Arenibaculum pallidiluteum TaxID=2812559 RepID=UPI001A96126A|nr:L-threonylcarbamoyladenylate synthase [Arenibaculum pallidiluteum]
MSDEPDTSPVSGPAPGAVPAPGSAEGPALLHPSDAAIGRAAELIRAGGLVAFPTETVYGLGADATSDRAVAAIFAAKGRPSFNPLIVHVPDTAAAEEIVLFGDRSRDVAEAFWPGPLTLVLPRRPGCPVSLLVSAGLDTIAVRIPAHPVARALLRAAGRPVAAPSANRSGSVSPTTPLHVAEGLGSRVGLILAAGRCEVGVESTVLDLSGARPAILRPGGITRERLEALLGPVSVPSEDPAAPRSPGQLASHYAPGRPVRLDAAQVGPDEALLAFGPDAFLRGGRERLNLSPSGDLEEAAANLFAMLRSLDRPENAAIAVMPIPERGLGVAINDRLRRAAAPRTEPEPRPPT